ncbi:oxidoreductase [Hyaloraphidium curvatum]|nr:oxidoreductase [Hyaloraphidium curvatum]
MPALRALALDPKHHVLVGSLPRELLLTAAAFEDLWNLHPAEFASMTMYGRDVLAPRWSQNYGKEYRFPGSRPAKALFPVLQRFLDWARVEIDPRLNGALVNWYDGSLEHYIGKHRDKDEGRIVGSPIVTISFGAGRTLRMRKYKGTAKKDISTADHNVIVIPWDTNKAYTHEVPKKKGGRRISITLRAFKDD